MSSLRNILQRCARNASILGGTPLQIQCASTFIPVYSNVNYISRLAYSSVGNESSENVTHSAQKSSFGQMDRALNSSPVPVTNVLDLSPKTTTVSQKAFFSGSGSRGEAYLEVKDVPEDVTQEELIEFFSKYGRVSACRLNTGRTGIIHAYVYYSAIDELNCAMDDLPHIFGGKPLNTMFKNVGHYNSAPLFVGSLPENVTEETLRDEFSKYGKLVYWKLENDGRINQSRPFGIVRYESDEETLNALKSGPHTIDGAVVDVKKASEALK